MFRLFVTCLNNAASLAPIRRCATGSSEKRVAQVSPTSYPYFLLPVFLLAESEMATPSTTEMEARRTAEAAPRWEAPPRYVNSE